jgi:transposase
MSNRVRDIVRNSTARNAVSTSECRRDSRRTPSSRNISQFTRTRAEGLGITLVFLPVASPHLRLIEPVWNSLKRTISPITTESADDFRALVAETFLTLTQRLSFAADWIDRFLITSGGRRRSRRLPPRSSPGRSEASLYLRRSVRTHQLSNTSTNSPFTVFLILPRRKSVAEVVNSDV